MSKTRRGGDSVQVNVELPLNLEESFPDSARRLQLQLAAGDIAQGIAVREVLRGPVVEALNALAAALWRREIADASFVETTRAAAQVADALLQRGAVSSKVAVLDAIEKSGLDGKDGRVFERVRVALLRIQKERAAWRARRRPAPSVQKTSPKRTRKR